MIAHSDSFAGVLAAIVVSLAEYQARREELELMVTTGKNIVIRDEGLCVVIGSFARSTHEQEQDQIIQAKIDADLLAASTPLTPEERQSLKVMFEE